MGCVASVLPCGSVVLVVSVPLCGSVLRCGLCTAFWVLPLFHLCATLSSVRLFHLCGPIYLCTALLPLYL